MKTIIKIYREVEIPKEYEYLFKPSVRPKWKNIDWDKVDLNEDNYFILCKKITKMLNPTDEWDFIDE